MLKRYGGTEASEQSVAAALHWIARHQNKNGSWSLAQFRAQCLKDACDGAGSEQSDAAATAFGLLPFLAAGLTHKTEGEHQRTVHKGIDWLLRNQQPNGDFSGTAVNKMYSHGLATIALCEAYALSRDARIGFSAQAAINFIQLAQDKNGGGWRYHPGMAGDTSVLGWQVMALKTGELAGLKIDPKTFDGARKFLVIASGEQRGWKFGYIGPGPTPSMVGVGLLCRQHLGATRDDPGLAEGSKYLMANLPDEKEYRNTYYWYYATQVMHNMGGDDWDKWNKKMRDTLVESQVKANGCAAGSWSPETPAPDAWGKFGGRLMTTSLSCLCLQNYYRYSPLYAAGMKAAPKKAAPKEKEPAGR